jgi:DNA-binding response OmpR family regulator
MVKFDGTEISSNTHFFVLEDTVIYQKRIVTSLKTLGFTGRVTVASSIDEAKTLLEGIMPDCFLCDWNLPDGIGTDFVTLIRSKFELKNAPILMITTMDDASNMIQAVQLGADGYVVKPYYPNDLLETLAFAFDKRANLPFKP